MAPYRSIIIFRIPSKFQVPCGKWQTDKPKEKKRTNERVHPGILYTIIVTGCCEYIVCTGFMLNLCMCYVLCVECRIINFLVSRINLQFNLADFNPSDWSSCFCYIPKLVASVHVMYIKHACKGLCALLCTLCTPFLLLQCHWGRDEL
jgi:hypothetical protein